MPPGRRRLRQPVMPVAEGVDHPLAGAGAADHGQAVGDRRAEAHPLRAALIGGQVAQEAGRLGVKSAASARGWAAASARPARPRRRCAGRCPAAWRRSRGRGTRRAASGRRYAGEADIVAALGLQRHVVAEARSERLRPCAGGDHDHGVERVRRAAALKQDAGRAGLRSTAATAARSKLDAPSHGRVEQRLGEQAGIVDVRGIGEERAARRCAR